MFHEFFCQFVIPHFHLLCLDNYSSNLIGKGVRLQNVPHGKVEQEPRYKTKGKPHKLFIFALGAMT